MNKKLLLLPILLAGAGAAYWWMDGRDQMPADTALTLYGNVDNREVDLAFAASEQIAALLVQEGEPVKPGQFLLGLLQTEKREAEVAAAQATVDARAQAPARPEAGSRPEGIRRARAEADARKAKAWTAQITYVRQRKLAAAEDVDQARAAADAAEVQARAAEETHALAVDGARAEDIA